MEELLRPKNIQRIKNIKADEDSDDEENVDNKDINELEDENEGNKEIPKNNIISKARDSRKWTKIASDLNDRDLINEVNEEGNNIKIFLT